MKYFRPDNNTENIQTVDIKIVFVHGRIKHEENIVYEVITEVKFCVYVMPITSCKPVVIGRLIAHEYLMKLRQGK